MGINLEFEEMTKNGSLEQWERWNIKYGGIVVAWDMNTDAEYILFAAPVFNIPVGFEGYVRIDFSQYWVPEWETDGDFILDLTKPIDSRNVIIVEDIVDTGRTLKIVKGILENREPKSLRIAALLDKPEGRVVECQVDYAGFNIPNEFVVGFGLDYNELYRNLPYVGVLKEECYM